MSELLAKIDKLSLLGDCVMLRTKASVVKVEQYSHRLTGKSEQSITADLSRWNPREKKNNKKQKKNDGSV